MRKIMKSLIVFLTLLLVLTSFPSLNFASTNLQSDSSLEKSQVDENELETNLNGDIQPNAIIGGGVITCQGLTGYAECDIDLVSTRPLTSGQLTVRFYKIVDGTKTLSKYYNLPVRGLNGKTFVELVTNPVLTKGSYQASVHGYIYGYESDIPYNVATFWSTKFTVK
ncbi:MULTISPECIES: hypothetical protein [Bacillaceae]|uniref:hypothetical protein n=1 Tax=Bacillaceae TaxID=186817 RepID=UPI000BA4EBFB|nr:MULTISPECIES: hypothetical protein [Bacillaceae]PAE23648.1 hypothetical protein CHI10_16940 [Bacillus sp. 7894-2]URM34603.1 hypothetical protein LLY41_09550 [Cytobacillus firmus]